MLAGEAFPLLAGGKSLVAISYTVATTSLVVQNLRSFLIGQGLWNGTDAIDLTFTIPSGKSVWSNNKAYAAIEVLAADFPADSVITIANQGLISGKGDWSPAGGALKATRPIIVDNTGGTLAGGGNSASGSAGSGCNGVLTYNGEGGYYCSYCTPGAGGTGYGYGYSSAGSPQTTGGTGSSCGGGTVACGISSDQTVYCSCSACPGGAGGVGGGPGSSGYCVTGNGFVSWLGTGTRYGSIS